MSVKADSLLDRRYKADLEPGCLVYSALARVLGRRHMERRFHALRLAADECGRDRLGQARLAPCRTSPGWDRAREGE